MYDLPMHIWGLALTGAIGIPLATSAALYRSALAAGLGRHAALAVAATTVAGLGGWLVVSALLARAGVYGQTNGTGAGAPRFLVAVGGPLTVLLLTTRLPLVARLLAAPGTLARLTLPHTLRVAGVLFLLVMAQGHLPAAFALPAGLGDIAIGLTAPFVARRLARGGGRAAALRFNMLGLLDLVVAATIGYLLFGLVAVTPSTAALRLLPLALIPTVPVPLAVALHLVALQRLRTVAVPDAERDGRRRATPHVTARQAR